MKKFCILSFSLLLMSSIMAQIEKPCSTCQPGGFEYQSQIDNFQINYPGCTEITGQVWIVGDDITNLEGLSVVTFIHDGLWIMDSDRLTDLEGLDNLTDVWGDGLTIVHNDSLLNLNGLGKLVNCTPIFIGNNSSLISLQGINENFPGHQIFIEDNPILPNLTGLPPMTYLFSLVIYRNNALNSLTGLESLIEVGNYMFIEFNPSLTDLNGLNHLTTVQQFIIQGNQNLTSLGLNELNTIKWKLNIKNNSALVDLTGLESLERIEGDLSILENDNLISLSGLNNLISLGSLNISDNAALNTLAGLETLDSIGWILTIRNNDSLTSLQGIDSIKYIGESLIVHANNSLAICDVHSVCEYLNNPDGNTSILGNHTGCNNIAEVEAACALHCLPGGITFSTQSQVDSFHVYYPGCVEIEGDVMISGTDIYDLDGLSVLTGIGGNCNIFNNPQLLDLSGLDNLQFTEGSLSISENPILTSLAGLDNITAGSIWNLFIYNNMSLSTCEAQSICDYLASPNGITEIHDNATGCNSQDEVVAACGFGLTENLAGIECVVFPNPSHDLCTITLTLEHQMRINLDVLNYYGIAVTEILDEMLAQGKHQVIWNTEGLAPGIYFFRLTAGNQASTMKIVVMKKSG